MKTILFAFSFLLSIVSAAQEKPAKYNPITKPNTYRNLDNPNYWKNKMPHSDYWQQDVYYQIYANIDEQKDIIEGKQTLTYWNNSPDELTFVYFHLYQNAFQPCSYHAELNTQNNNKIDYGPYEEDQKGTEIHTITSVGRKILLEQDNTVLKVHFNKPIKSGESIEFNIEFTTYFGKGNMGRRMQKFESNGKMHYNGVHWYPRISVYDSKFGWTTDQHLGKEFYGNFGAFDVELTFASNYIVEATGFMTNRDQMLPTSLRKKLDIKNFVNKPWNETASEIIKYDPEERKTWKFHAENVHDFAFTADPSYRIGEATWNGVTCYSLAQEQHASKWQNAADYAAKTIEVFSNDFGMYTYHKMIVADARDGMEYPMLTLDGGSDPSYRGLLVHEIGHNWFYGQVGNNETYRAALDEGFTQFLTAWGLEKIDGVEMEQAKTGIKYIDNNTKPLHPRDRSIYYSYIKDATKNNTPRLNTHSDDFDSALGHGGGYRHVYYKTAAMLYNLQYVLGDELFIEAMKNYFETWKFAHPYVDDFRKSIINYTKVDLNWFFDQWLETTKDIDYGIKKVRLLKGSDELYEITFERKSAMQMPIDFTVIDNHGSKKKYHIPNTWFHKKTDAIVLDKWYGFGKIHPTHSVIVRSPNKIENVIIDPSNRLADAFMVDNSWKRNRSIEMEDFVWSYPDWKNYEATLKPLLWYNGYDGIKLGINVVGDYMNYHNKLDAKFWLNTGFYQTKNNLPLGVIEFYDSNSEPQTKQVRSNSGYDLLSFQINYEKPLNKINKGLVTQLEIRNLEGLNLNRIRLSQTSHNGGNNFYIELKTMIRPELNGRSYLLLPDEWGINKANNTLTVGINHKYYYRYGNGQLNIDLRSSTIGSSYDYSQLSFEAINRNKLKKFDINTRFFAQYSTGTIAAESRLYAAGANPEQMMENKYTSSAGIISRDIMNISASTNHFQLGGGLNLRGYAGYYLPEGELSNQEYTYNAKSGASCSFEIDFEDYLPFRNTFNLRTYLFSDLGVLLLEDGENFGTLRADAGLGLGFNLFNHIDNIKPLSIRIDMPWYLNSAPYGEENIDFNRFLIGINRSF